MTNDIGHVPGDETHGDGEGTGGVGRGHLEDTPGDRQGAGRPRGRGHALGDRVTAPGGK